MNTATVIGWDIGGAHVKAALLREGVVRAVVQRPCPLWLGLDRLAAAVADVRQALEGWAPEATSHGVTMTGELADGFADRADGVTRIAATLAALLAPASVQIFGMDRTGTQAAWCAPEQAAAHWRRIASANWWATAAWTARRLPDALLVDIGSTTTDFMAVRGGRVAAQGHDDHARLCSGELVYQGVVRTPLCALGTHVHWAGRDCGVMNEWFATTADVYRLTGELDPDHDQQPAADQGAKDVDGSRQRLARMVGLDAGDAGAAQWQALAEQWRARQLDTLKTALDQVLAATSMPAATPLVAAGCGAFLVAELAQHAARPLVAWQSLVDTAEPAVGRWAAVCAPCVAVAHLLAESSGARGHGT